MPGAKRKRSSEDLDLSVVIGKCEDLLESIRSLPPQAADELSWKLSQGGLEPRARDAMKLVSDQLRKSEAGPQTAEEEDHIAHARSQDASLQVPGFTSISKWTSTERTELPPLLKVLDPALESVALTHTGLVKGFSGLGYERLEWLGDAYVHIVSSLLIYQTFPTYDPGRMTQLRELLIRNATLADFTLKYGLDRRASLPEEFKAEGRLGGTTAGASKKQKIYGDLFEAYAAAVVVADPQHGVARLTPWLKTLWRPVVSDHLRREENRVRNDAAAPAPVKEGDPAQRMDVEPKVRLRLAIGFKGVNLRYEEIDSGRKRDKDNNKLPLFTVGVFLDGWGEHNKQLGFGSALSKKEAGQKAAQNALDNKKQLKVYIKMKEKMQAAAPASEQGRTKEAEEKLEVP